MSFLKKLTFWKREAPYEVIDSLEDLEKYYYDYDDHYFVDEELVRKDVADQSHLKIVSSQDHSIDCHKDFDSHGCE